LSYQPSHRTIASRARLENRDREHVVAVIEASRPQLREHAESSHEWLSPIRKFGNAHSPRVSQN